MLILKKLRFLNFKGLRDYTITFDPIHTAITGRNGTFKTTIFDGFSYLLHHTDSQGSPSFELKTTDENNEVIWKLPHEVEGTFDNNGVELVLKKTHTERWEFPRGESQDVFRGHKTKYYVDDVPMNAGEYAAYIATIIDPTTFKLITNPLYFNDDKLMPWRERREVLFAMAGYDENMLAAQDDRFKKLLAIFRTKTEVGYKKELATKKKKLKDEKVLIPARIDEKKRSIKEVKDWAAIEASIKAKEAEIQEQNDILLGTANAIKLEDKKRQEITDKQRTVRLERERIVAGIEKEVLEGEHERTSGYTLNKQKLTSLSSRKTLLEQEYKDLLQKIERKTAERALLMDQWSEQNRLKFEIDPNKTSCPQCKREFDGDKLQETISELKRAFNTDKVNKLKSIEIDGKATKDVIDANIKLKDDTKKKLDAITTEQETLTAAIKEFEEKDALQTSTADKISFKVANDKAIAEKDAELSDLDKELDGIEKTEPDQQVKEKIQVLNDELIALRKELDTRESIKKDNERIEELKEQEKTLAQEIANYEKVEDAIREMNKAKIALVDATINSLFSLAKFRLFNTLIDGSLEECCECTYKGVSYPGVNTGHRILVGIDIINVLCKYYNASAPVFIDSAESVTEPLNCNSQVIELIAKKLTVEDAQHEIKERRELLIRRYSETIDEITP